MFDADADLDEASRLVDDWQAKLEDQAARARALSGRVAGLTARAASSDGLIEVTVSSTGALTDLYLDEAIRRQPAAETAAKVMAALRDAQASLVDDVSAAVAETVGLESAAGRAIIASYARRSADAPE
jgi:DNA-binding protein YbaB